MKLWAASLSPSHIVSVRQRSDSVVEFHGQQGGVPDFAAHSAAVMAAPARTDGRHVVTIAVARMSMRRVGAGSASRCDISDVGIAGARRLIDLVEYLILIGSVKLAPVL